MGIVLLMNRSVTIMQDIEMMQPAKWHSNTTESTLEH